MGFKKQSVVNNITVGIFVLVTSSKTRQFAYCKILMAACEICTSEAAEILRGSLRNTSAAASEILA